MTTFLLTNNPAEFDSKWAGDVRRLRAKGHVSCQWSTQSHKLMKPGDEVYLLRLGSKGRGIFGRGRVLKSPRPDGQWSGRRKTEEAYYVQTEIVELVDPESAPILSQDQLKARFPHQQWSPQSSGIRVQADVVSGLRQLWSRHYAQAKKQARMAVATPPTADSIQFAKGVRSLLSSKISIEPKGEAKPEQVTTKVRRIIRDPAVHAFVMQEAKGKCECCRRKAPFVGDDGRPFLELHHLKQLAHGGPDTVANAVAVCPNCHRALHHGKARRMLVAQMQSRIGRLRRTR